MVFERLQKEFDAARASQTQGRFGHCTLMIYFSLWSVIWLLHVLFSASCDMQL